MKYDRLEPARSVIEKLGVDVVAEVTGKHVSRVYRWMAPKSRGGTDGYIPPVDAELLLTRAHEAGWDLTPADFFIAGSPANEAGGVTEQAAS